MTKRPTMRLRRPAPLMAHKPKADPNLIGFHNDPLGQMHFPDSSVEVSCVCGHTVRVLFYEAREVSYIANTYMPGGLCPQCYYDKHGRHTTVWLVEESTLKSGAKCCAYYPSPETDLGCHHCDGKDH